MQRLPRGGDIMQKLFGHVLIKLGVLLDPCSRLEWHEENRILHGLGVAFEAIRLEKVLWVGLLIGVGRVVPADMGGGNHVIRIILHPNGLDRRRGI